MAWRKSWTRLYIGFVSERGATGVNLAGCVLWERSRSVPFSVIGQPGHLSGEPGCAGYRYNLTVEVV